MSDAYIAELQRRRTEWATAFREREAQSGHPWRALEWVVEAAPLERFVEPTDPQDWPAPPPPPTTGQAAPRRHRTAQDYQNRIRTNQARLDDTHAALAGWYETHYSRGTDFDYPTAAAIARKTKLEARAAALETRIGLDRARLAKHQEKTS